MTPSPNLKNPVAPPRPPANLTTPDVQALETQLAHVQPLQAPLRLHHQDGDVQQGLWRSAQTGDFMNQSEFPRIHQNPSESIRVPTSQVGAADLAGVNHLNGRGNPARPGLNYGHLLASVPAHILAKILDIFHLDFVLFGYDKGPLLELLSQKNEELLNKTVLR